MAFMTYPNNQFPTLNDYGIPDNNTIGPSFFEAFEIFLKANFSSDSICSNKGQRVFQKLLQKLGCVWNILDRTSMLSRLVMNQISILFLRWETSPSKTMWPGGSSTQQQYNSKCCKAISMAWISTPCFKQEPSLAPADFSAPQMDLPTCVCSLFTQMCFPRSLQEADWSFFCL
jgi:hypothetical protein